MKHERAATLLAEWRGGMLPEAESDEVAAHVESCAECRELIEALDAAGAYLAHERAAYSGHLETAEIVAAGMSFDGASPDERRRIESHLRSCERCREEVGRVRECEETLQAGGRVVPFRRPWLPAAAAAALLLGLLGYPAWRGVAQLPGLESEARLLREARERDRSRIATLEESLRGSRAWSGAVDLVPVRGGRRGSPGDATVVEIGPSDRFVLLALDPALSPEDPDSMPVRFELASADGRVLWASEMAAGEVRGHARAAGLLALVVPAERFEEGELVLTVAGGGPDGARVRSRAALRVERRAE